MRNGKTRTDNRQMDKRQPTTDIGQDPEPRKQDMGDGDGNYSRRNAKCE